MSLRIKTAALSGLEAAPVEVEASIAPGLPSVTIVGLPDTAVQEARERVRSAIRASGFNFPNQRVTINLAPADFKKAGPIFDLPISLAVLRAMREIPDVSERQCFMGELSLEGLVRPVQGVLPIVEFARASGHLEVFLPKGNAREASIVKGIRIIPLDSLIELVEHLRGGRVLKRFVAPKTFTQLAGDSVQSAGQELSEIRGQALGKRAIEIAAAGAHNLLMTGPPGSGKTLLAKALATILPPLSYHEAIEVTKIFSIAGLLDPNHPLILKRPFRSPHHTASAAAIVGGGRNPRPGEITLAHRGVLFLDELAEFPRIVLESLRQPLEEGLVTVARVAGSVQYPARLLLVGAQNPCPCGYYGDSERPCVCPPSVRVRYLKRLSGPLLDRFDLIVSISRLPVDELLSRSSDQNAGQILMRVSEARARQQERFALTKVMTNAELNNASLERLVQLDPESLSLLRVAIDKFQLTARAYHRILRVSRTIADLAGEDRVRSEHVAEAVQYRGRYKAD